MKKLFLMWENYQTPKMKPISFDAKACQSCDQINQITYVNSR